MQGTGLRDQAQRFDEANCVVLGISYDTPEDNRAFRQQNGFPFRLLSDTDRAVGASYGATRDPGDPYADYPRRVSYLIDPDGKVVRSYEVTDPGGHAAQVLTDLQAAQR